MIRKERKYQRFVQNRRHYSNTVAVASAVQCGCVGLHCGADRAVAHTPPRTGRVRRCAVNDCARLSEREPALDVGARWRQRRQTNASLSSGECVLLLDYYDTIETVRIRNRTTPKVVHMNTKKHLPYSKSQLDEQYPFMNLSSLVTKEPFCCLHSTYATNLNILQMVRTVGGCRCGLFAICLRA